MDRQQELVKASQFAAFLGEKWTRQRVHTELKRGTIPDPYMYVGNQPLWTKSQVEGIAKIKGV